MTRFLGHRECGQALVFDRPSLVQLCIAFLSNVDVPLIGSIGRDRRLVACGLAVFRSGGFEKMNAGPVVFLPVC